MFRIRATRPDSESTPLLVWHVHRIHPRVVVLLKRVMIEGLLSARLNLLVDQRPAVRNCAETLLHDRLEYVQNIRSLEYCACT